VILKNRGQKAVLIFGDMSWEERDEYVAKFRTGEVSVILTTNMLARGLDVPEVQVVINFDVPRERDEQGTNRGDPETYLHRIGRTGRFGERGIAITLYDHDEDKKYLD
jgi:ATP-dependent RNA helicase DDX19/DBP5